MHALPSCYKICENRVCMPFASAGFDFTYVLHVCSSREASPPPFCAFRMQHASSLGRFWRAPLKWWLVGDYSVALDWKSWINLHAILPPTEHNLQIINARLKPTLYVRHFHPQPLPVSATFFTFRVNPSLLPTRSYYPSLPKILPLPTKNESMKLPQQKATISGWILYYPVAKTGLVSKG